MAFGEDPRFLDWRTLYRLCRRELARVVGVPTSTLDGYFAEIAPARVDLARQLAELPRAGALMQAPLLYVLVRALRPRAIVETGISSGYSSYFLLAGLRANGRGRLVSLGLPEVAVSVEHEARFAPERRVGARPVGWLVPDELRAPWEIRFGPSETLLEPVVRELDGDFDVFLHDSAHRYATMRFEYETAWSHLGPGGTLLSHDVHASAAWPEFVRAHPSAPEAELDHDLGIVRRLDVPGR